MRKSKKRDFHPVASAFDSGVSCGAFDNYGLGELRRRGRKGWREEKSFHPIDSASDSDVFCGAFDVEGLGELRRRGRNGRERRKASRRAITGVGRSW